MERLHMNYLRDILHRLHTGDSQRRIARGLKISRSTVSKYRDWAEAQGYLQLDCTLPDAATLAAALGDPPRLPRQESSVEPYQEVVQRLLDQGVEMTAIWQRLQKNHGYTGSYSSIRRFAKHLRPAEPDAVVRVHTFPGDEAQVDFFRTARLYDPASGRVRTAYVFVATLLEEPFTLCEIKLLTVHPDCHVSFDGSYYSVPYAYLGHRLEVHIHEQIVAIYQAQKLVASMCAVRNVASGVRAWKTTPPTKPST